MQAGLHALALLKALGPRMCSSLDANEDAIRPALDVLPGHLPRTHRVHLSVQWHKIVIVRGQLSQVGSTNLIFWKHVTLGRTRML